MARLRFPVLAAAGWFAAMVLLVPPLHAQAPAGATAACGDGTYSHAASRRGACSGHNGIKTWYGNQAAAAAPAPRTSAPVAAAPQARAPAGAEAAPHAGHAVITAAEATAICNDGTYSAAQRHVGACSRHGGVKQWLKDEPMR